jgi:hypothetical protein
MDIDKYDYVKNDASLVFQFESVGPNGKVLKVVQFTPHNYDGITYFNLGFGDWNEVEQRIEDLSITNNNDREKVLATVAATVLEFLEHFPDMMVFAQGSTPSRTRLYQIGIVMKYTEIASLLNIYGFINGEWERFKANSNYEAFLVSLK